MAFSSSFPLTWSQTLAKTPLFHAKLLAPYSEGLKSISGEPLDLDLLLSFAQNAQEESAVEVQNPRPEDAP